MNTGRVWSHEVLVQQHTRRWLGEHGRVLWWQLRHAGGRHVQLPHHHQGRAQYFAIRSIDRKNRFWKEILKNHIKFLLSLFFFCTFREIFSPESRTASGPLCRGSSSLTSLRRSWRWLGRSCARRERRQWLCARPELRERMKNPNTILVSRCRIKLTCKNIIRRWKFIVIFTITVNPSYEI